MVNCAKWSATNAKDTLIPLAFEIEQTVGVSICFRETKKSQMEKISIGSWSFGHFSLICIYLKK